MSVCACLRGGVRLLISVLFIALWLCPAGAVDLDFVAAYKKKDVRALQRHFASATEDPLEPYLIARIADGRDISEGRLSPALLRALDRFAGVPPIEELRSTALKAWARKGDWERFAAHIDRVPEWLVDRDVEIQCARISFLRFTKHPVGALRSELFGRLTEFPALCMASFDDAVATGQITPDQVIAKLMYIGSMGKKCDAERLLDMLGLDRDTKASLRSVGEQILEVLNTARSDYRDGTKAFEEHKHAFNHETAKGVLLHVGVIGARKLEPEAHSLIKSADGYRRPLLPAAAEWRTRAALFSGAWADVIDSIESMPAAFRDEPTWRYWRARSLEHMRRSDEAKVVYAELSRHPGYYGILASERLGRKPPYLDHKFSADEFPVEGFENRPEMIRALALYRVGLWSEAARELNIMLRGADSSTFYAAALYSKDNGLLDRQISFAQRASDHIDLRLRYPLVYSREVSESAERTGLPPELLWAVIRQESRFVPYAVSSAGAVGLMQLMPATARQVSKATGRSRKLTNDALMAPSLNISLGSAFLKSTHSRYDGNCAFAAAAYNAGPGRVDRWQRQLRGIDVERFIELIPFTETRDYTKQVLSNYVFYSYVAGKEPVSLSSLAATKI